MKRTFRRLVGLLIGVLWVCGRLEAIELPPLTTQAANPRAEATTMTASVNSLMVYGEDKFQMKSQKVVTVLTKNINDPVASLLDMPLDLALDLAPDEQLFQQSLGTVGRLHSDQILRPLLLSHIPASPFIRYEVSASGKAVESWTFKVVAGDSRAVVFQQNGTGANLPNLITWDGRDANRRLVVEPGKKYYWEFAGFDRARKKVQARKAAFQLWAFTYDQDRERMVVITLAKLFKPNSQTELSGLGKDLLNETADYFREGGSDRMELLISAATPEAASGLGSNLGRYLAQTLMLETDRVRVQPQNLAGNTAGRVEIRFSRVR